MSAGMRPGDEAPDEGDGHVLEWLPRRGRWLGPAIVGVAFAAGLALGTLGGMRLERGRSARGEAEPPSPATASAAVGSDAGTAPNGGDAGTAPTGGDAQPAAIEVEGPVHRAELEPAAEDAGSTASHEPTKARPERGERAEHAERAERAEARDAAATEPQEGVAAADDDVWVDVKLESEPPGAAVFSSLGKLGVTPLSAFLPAHRETALRFELEGHAVYRATWSGSQGANQVRAVLVPASP